MMKVLFSWLPDADDERLNDFFLCLDLASHRNECDALKKTVASIRERCLSQDLQQLSIIEKELPFSQHAFLESSKGYSSVTINTRWLNEYQEYMSANQARMVHFSHEQYHYYEQCLPAMFYYSNEKRIKRRILAEAGAKLYSQYEAGLPYYPSLYDFAIGLKQKNYTEHELTQYLEEKYHAIYHESSRKENEFGGQSAGEFH